MGYKVANNVWATMPGTVAPGDTSFALTASHGARFAFCSGANNYTWATLINTATTPVQTEVVKLTYSGSGDSVNVIRAQDGTSALTISTPGAARLEVRIPRKLLEDLAHAEDLQTTADIRAVTVGGTASAITSTHDRPLSAIVGAGGTPTDGMISVFEPAAANDAAVVTYSPDGLVAKPIRQATPFGTPNGLALGDLTPGQKAIVVFDSSSDCWLLVNPANRGFAMSPVYTSGITITRGFHTRTVRMNGTFGVLFSAASALGSDFWCVLDNIGTGLVTLDPNGTELLVFSNGTNQQTHQMGHGAMLIVADGSGTGFRCFPLGGHPSSVKVWDVAGSYQWLPGPMTREVAMFCLGAGGGGGGGFAHGTGAGSGGGGGGAGAMKFERFTSGWSGTNTVTVGAGGTAGGSQGGVAAGTGGASSVGALITAGGGLGGGGGGFAVGGSGGAGATTSGAVPGNNGANGTYSASSARPGGTGGANPGAQAYNSLGGAPGASGSGSYNQDGSVGKRGGGGGGGEGGVGNTSNGGNGGAGGAGLVIIWEF